MLAIQIVKLSVWVMMAFTVGIAIILTMAVKPDNAIQQCVVAAQAAAIFIALYILSRAVAESAESVGKILVSGKSSKERRREG